MPLPLLPILLASGAAAAAWSYFKKPAMTVEQKAAAMARLADLLHKVIAKIGTPAERGPWAEEAAKLAVDAFQLTQTAAGIRSGVGLPKTEMWPGSQESVAAYMEKYINLRKPKPLAVVKANTAPVPVKIVYNDEVPVVPFEDPRKVRDQALALEKQGKTLEARIYHAKADGLNNLIKAAKLKNTAVDVSKALAGIFK